MLYGRYPSQLLRHMGAIPAIYYVIWALSQPFIASYGRYPSHFLRRVGAILAILWGVVLQGGRGLEDMIEVVHVLQRVASLAPPANQVHPLR